MNDEWFPPIRPGICQEPQDTVISTSIHKTNTFIKNVYSFILIIDKFKKDLADDRIKNYELRNTFERNAKAVKSYTIYIARITNPV